MKVTPLFQVYFVLSFTFPQISYLLIFLTNNYCLKLILSFVPSYYKSKWSHITIYNKRFFPSISRNFVSQAKYYGANCIVCNYNIGIPAMCVPYVCICCSLRVAIILNYMNLKHKRLRFQHCLFITQSIVWFHLFTINMLLTTLFVSNILW